MCVCVWACVYQHGKVEMGGGEGIEWPCPGWLRQQTLTNVNKMSLEEGCGSSLPRSFLDSLLRRSPAPAFILPCHAHTSLD